MRIIPAKPATKRAADVAVFPAPTELMRKALVVDGEYEEAAAPAIRRAASACERINRQFRDAIPDEIERLASAFEEYRPAPHQDAARQKLFRLAHDLRGSAASLDEAFVARVARSMAHLMTLCTSPPAGLLRAHVDALRAAKREKIRDLAHPLAGELVEELERRVQDAIDGESACIPDRG